MKSNVCLGVLIAGIGAHALSLSGNVATTYVYDISTRAYDNYVRGSDGYYTWDSKADDLSQFGSASGAFRRSAISSFYSIDASTVYLDSDGFYDYTGKFAGLNDTHSRAKVYIDSASNTLKAQLIAASAQGDGTEANAAFTSASLNTRSYYRAEGTEPLTVRLTFNYDGAWDASGVSGSYAEVNVGSFLTLVKDAGTYFDENGVFLQGITYELAADLGGMGWYNGIFGAGQQVADMVASHSFSSYRMKSPIDETATYDITVNPGDLLLVDTYFSGRVGVQTDSGMATRAEVDFLHTTYSQIEVIGGDGSLVPESMPIAVPEPLAVYLISMVGALVVIRRRGKGH